MKCARCGAEIKDGCLYCSVCGYEVQMVPDYNVLEEELLTDILDQENHRAGKPDGTDKEQKQRTKRAATGAKAEKSGQTAHSEKAARPQKTENPHDPGGKRASDSSSAAKHHAAKKRAQEENRKGKNSLALVVGIASAGVVLACVILLCVMSYNNSHSFTYQFNQGLAAEASGNYSEALDYLERAKEIEPDNLDVRYEMADIYLTTGQREKAVELLKEITVLEPSGKKAYRKLIDLYEEDEDYDAILNLYEKTDNAAIQALFSDYLVAEPEFGKKSGDYEENIKITLTSADGAKIYYTLDGTSPQEYGRLYSEPIELAKEGEYELLAVCENEKGLCSDVAKGHYTITYTAPDRPTLLPGSGTFEGEGQTITIQVPAGCNAYYIWNNGEDDSAWGKSEVVSHCTMYVEPIPMASGNNILEVFTVSPNGKISRPTKGNYIYNQ